MLQKYVGIGEIHFKDREMAALPDLHALPFSAVEHTRHKTDRKKKRFFALRGAAAEKTGYGNNNFFSPNVSKQKRSPV